MTRTLSLCMMARKPAPRVRAILELFRPLVDEIVLAADRTGDPRILEACADLADKRFELDPAPLNRRLGWLHVQCEGDWVFRIDDDEAPSRRLLDVLPTLVHERSPMQVAFSRRWLFGTPERWISSDPWTPDYPVRLVRNTPGAWHFPAVMHAPIGVLGELRHVDAPIYHCDLLLAPLRERRRKRALYESRRPGYRNGNFPVNWYYTPEDCVGVETAPTPADDLDLIQRVRSGSRSEPEAPRSPAREVSAVEAERFNASRDILPDAYRAELTLVRTIAELDAGTARRHELVVRNLGGEPWPWGDFPPFFRPGYRWWTPDGDLSFEGRGGFSETVEPGETTRLLMWIEAPPTPGSYTLEIDVVHEEVRWFGCGVTLDVQVTEPVPRIRPPRRLTFAR